MRRADQSGSDGRGRAWRLALLVACLGALAAAAPAAAVVPTDPIDRIAGIGSFGDSGDNGPAVLAQLNAPQGVAVDALNRVWIADGGNGHLRRIDADGIIRRVATGFGEPSDVAIDAQGNAYVAGASDNRVFRVTPSGSVANFAGDGTATTSGDNGAALSAGVNEPRGVAVDAAGNVYIAETGGNRVRMVTPAGAIVTVAGTGAAGFSGDGGPAVLAELSGPRDVAVAPGGSVVVVDSVNGRARRIGGDGIIRTIAGNGDFPGACPATPTDAGATPLDFPTRAAVDNSGNVYLAHENCVSKVDGAGRIQRIAGNGAPGDSGDGGPAGQSVIQASGVAVDAEGSLVVSAGLSNKVRRVLNVLPVAAFTAASPAPLVIEADAGGSSAGQPGEALSAFAWDFGDGAGAQGVAARHAYGAPGTYTVRLTVRDDSGATATTTRSVTVAGPPPPPPPPIVVAGTRSSVAGGYRKGRLNATLRIAGTTTGAGTATVRLARRSGPSAEGLSTSAALTLRLTQAGPFAARLRLPPRLAPGTYALTIDGRPFLGRAGRVSLARPPTGIVLRAFVSAVQNGPPARALPLATKRLFCHFRFAVLPLRGRTRVISTQWTAPGASLGRVTKPLSRRVVGVLSTRSGFEPGRYVCTLRVGRAVIASVAARIR